MKLSMKPSLWTALILILVSCNTTQLKEHWKNPDITSYKPSKVLVVGLTSNIESRQEFESKLKMAIELRGIEAVRSLDIIHPAFDSKKMTENDIHNLENTLVIDGFDTVLLSKIIGVEDKIEYKANYDDYDETHVKFKEDYLKYQDVFYNPHYYDEYSLYHAETSMFCICPKEERTIIWKGYIDILDPRSGDNTINNYVNLIIAVLEDEQLMNSILEGDNEVQNPLSNEL